MLSLLIDFLTVLVETGKDVKYFVVRLGHTERT